MNNSYTNKQAEWNNQALSSTDHSKQILRPIDSKSLKDYVKHIFDKLQLNEATDYLLDVGCGNGLMLSKLKENSKSIAGVDYAESMIEQAKKIVPEADLHVSEAKIIPFSDKTFDRVLCYSISHYFPSDDYIYQAIDEMIRVCKNNAVILLGDVLDQKFEKEIKDASDKSIEQKIPLIMRYSEWRFFDIESICKHYSDRGFYCEIVSQPDILKTSHYRKDILIRI
jgi:ubiquinone/menaquinone biosynthesis C-methylase UbiE